MTEEGGEEEAKEECSLKSCMPAVTEREMEGEPEETGQPPETEL